MQNNVYRDRLYSKYVSAQKKILSPVSIAELKPRAPYLQKVIKKHFPKDKNAAILELGCGYGALIYFAHKSGFTNIKGIDRSPEQVLIAHTLEIGGVEEGEILNTLAEQNNSSLDCIISFDVIEHFSRDELIPLVDEVYRVLKPSGQWVIHAPNGESPFFGRIRYGDLTHELCFTRTSIAQLLRSSGFSQVQSFEDEPIPHGFISAGRWLIWRIIRGILRLYIAVETGESGKETIFTQNFLTEALK